MTQNPPPIYLEKFLEQNGYENIRHINGRGYCGVKRFIFTTGLCYGLDESGYKGRYCFNIMAEANVALLNWDGVGHPKGNWIKHKGSIEFSNPNYDKE